MRREPLDLGAERPELFINTFISAVDLMNVIDLSRSVRAQASDQQRHASAYIWTLDLSTSELLRTYDHDAVRVAEYDLSAHCL